jgi:hypothetical protein
MHFVAPFMGRPYFRTVPSDVQSPDKSGGYKNLFKAITWHLFPSTEIGRTHSLSPTLSRQRERETNLGRKRSPQKTLSGPT